MMKTQEDKTQERKKKDFVLIKDFNTFMYNHTLHCATKNFFG